jgi:hypothetical protein
LRSDDKAAVGVCRVCEMMHYIVENNAHVI